MLLENYMHRALPDSLQRQLVVSAILGAGIAVELSLHASIALLNADRLQLDRLLLFVHDALNLLMAVAAIHELHARCRSRLLRRNH